MSLPALTIRHTAVTIEEQRDELREMDLKLNEQRKAFARRLWSLRLAFGLLHPKASTREFIAWFGDGEVQTRLYAYLRAGLALSSGLDAPHLRLGDLSAYGDRLQAGETPESIRAGNAPALPQTTTIRVTRETADALDQTFTELSEADTRLTRQDALETAVQAFAHAPAVIRRALVHAQATGENPLDALVQAVDVRRDHRHWLSLRGCQVPGCGVHSGVQLHHLKTGQDTRFRTRDVLLPLCQRHHEAEPGLTSEAAHAAHQEAWATRHWGSPEAFWLAVALLYVEYAQTTENA